jgi:hypothetical protein
MCISAEAYKLVSCYVSVCLYYVLDLRDGDVRLYRRRGDHGARAHSRVRQHGAQVRSAEQAERLVGQGHGELPKPSVATRTLRQPSCVVSWHDDEVQHARASEHGQATQVISDGSFALTA